MDFTENPARQILSEFCKEQYNMVIGSRKVLLDYCGQIDPLNFLAENTAYGRGGSMRNLLVHIANCYEFWIGIHALKKNMQTTAFNTAGTQTAIRDVFDRVDTMVFEFLDGMSTLNRDEISFDINGIDGSAPAFKLFTHVITHEFHHKGQLLSLSRQMGYTPVDTDVMR